MEVDIINITYVKEEAAYHIVTEFSRLPIETFQQQDQALEFIEGYLYGKVGTNTNIKGKLFKTFVDTDIRHGVQYKKVREIESVLFEVQI